MSDITPAEQKVLDAIKASYGGAVSIAAVHGWRFTGEAGEGGWPVSLLEALRQYGAEQRAPLIAAINGLMAALDKSMDFDPETRVGSAMAEARAQAEGT